MLVSIALTAATRCTKRLDETQWPETRDETYGAETETYCSETRDASVRDVKDFVRDATSRPRPQPCYWDYHWSKMTPLRTLSVIVNRKWTITRWQIDYVCQISMEGRIGFEKKMQKKVTSWFLPILVRAGATAWDVLDRGGLLVTAMSSRFSPATSILNSLPTTRDEKGEFLSSSLCVVFSGATK